MDSDVEAPDAARSKVQIVRACTLRTDSMEVTRVDGEVVRVRTGGRVKWKETTDGK